jgi:hypothetical protein
MPSAAGIRQHNRNDSLERRKVYSGDYRGLAFERRRAERDYMSRKGLDGAGGTSEGEPPRRKPDMAFDPVAAALKQMHDDVANESVPDEFNDLLDRLAARFEERKPS